MFVQVWREWDCTMLLLISNIYKIIYLYLYELWNIYK
jgi:hypothetical protein